MKHFLSVLFVCFSTQLYGIETGLFFEKSDTVKPASVSLVSVDKVTAKDAYITSKVSDESGTLTQRGICWSRTVSTLADGWIKIPDPSTESGGFTIHFSELNYSTTYYVRCYATNMAGTVYSSPTSFMTTAGTLATSTLLRVDSITSNSAVVVGNVSDDGGSTVTRGVCWSVSSTLAPESMTKVNASGSGVGNYRVRLSGLMNTTRYYVRSFTTNWMGTSYGPMTSFMTTAGTLATSSLLRADSITTTTAVLTGNVSDGGGSMVTRGVCWSTSPSAPPESMTKVNAISTGIGRYTVKLNGLFQGTIYYARSFTTNATGTSYGNLISFTTLLGK